MGIKGLSDIRRLPRAGKFHLGEKAISDKTGKEYSRALDYYLSERRVEPANSSANSTLLEASRKVRHG